MATPKDLLDYAGERLYRNSLDDILDQIQQDIDNERIVTQARQSAIVNDPDPVKKLREVQSIEKSVVNEPPEVQATVLNQTYNIKKPTVTGLTGKYGLNESYYLDKGPLKLDESPPQYTMGQPRGELQNLTEDDVRFRAELERIQEPFDRIFNEKLKTAKAIPGRSVTDPMTGSLFTTPEKTKEEVAKEQATRQLQEQGIIEPQFARTFLQSFIPLKIPGIEQLSPEQQAQQQEYYPIRNLIGQVGGALVGFKGINAFLNAPKLIKTGDTVRKGGKIIEETFRREPGRLTQIGVDLGKKISGTKLGNIIKDKGVTGATIQRFTTGATTGAGTFGAYSLIDQIDEDAPIADKALTITENAIFGAGFGLTGNIANRGARALADGTYGFVTSKLMEGATTEEALLNGLLFAGFGVLNNKNVAEVDRQFAIKDFAKQADEIFVLLQTMRTNAGKKAFTKLQQKQYTKVVEDFANELYGKGVSAKNIEKQTEEFLNRFLQTNDPKGSIAKIRQLGNQSKTQVLQAKAKAKKEAVTVPTTGTADKVTQDNVLRLSTGEQLRRMKGLGYTEDQFVRLSGKERQDILDNNIREENFVTEQPTRPSMPVPGPAPDVTPSTKKSDKLVPEKLEPKPKEVKPEVQPTKGEATGLKTTSLKPSDIKIDESKFQPREEYNQAVIDDIAKNFDPKKWDEPVLWQDPKTNEYIVVSGHHRHRGVVKGGYGSATYKVLPKGTTIDEAINMSEEGNLARTEQSAFENSKVVRRRFNKGDSLVKIADDLPGLTKAKSSAGKSNAVRRVLNLSYLDQNGKLKSNYDSVNEFPRIQSTSSYVGALRRQYDWMPDRYEDDVFTYLYTENGISQDDSDWKLNLESTLEKLVDVKDRPGSILKQLRKDPLQPKEGTSDEILEQIKDLKKSIDNIGSQLSDDKFLQREIDRIQKEKGLNDVDALQEVKRDLRKRRAELKTELKDLVEESSKPDPDQATMFEDVEQYNIFGGTDILKEVSKKDKEVLDQLHEELSNINKEQFFLTNQVSQNKINKLKARQQQKALDKRYKDTIEKMQKIDKPVNGATNKPGFIVDINEQIKLNLQNKKQTELFRETASKEDKENTKKLTSEVSRLRSRLGITTRATNILEPLEKVGASHFIGQRVKSPEELAVLAQVARDRRFETFYILYTNRQADGTDKIVQYTAVSNKMPGWVNPFYVKELGVYRPDYLTGYMYEVMRDSGADGYYLLHNHPSSLPKPSKGDLESTKYIMDNMPGFRSHVVINTEEFGYILPSKKIKGGLQHGMLPLQPDNRIRKDPLYDKNFDKLNINLDGDPGRIPSVLKNFADNKNVVSVFATNYSFQLNALVDIPIEKFLKVGRQRNFKFGMARLKAQIRKIARDYGGQRIFLVTNRTDGYPGGDYGALERVFRRLYKDNFITEGFLFADYAKPELGHNRVSNRTATWQGKLQFGESTRKSTRVITEAEYRGAHTAPSVNYGAPGHDLTEMYPDDIYGPNGARYYGHSGDSRGRKQDNDTIAIIRSLRNNPDKKINIYRAVPKAVKDINPGDWVTINKDYAKEHGERHLDSFRVLSKKVPAREIYTDGNSIHEWGWNPQTSVSPSQTKSPEFKKWFKGSQVKDKDGNPLVVYHGTVGDFDSFNTPAYFSDGKMASDFVMEEINSLGQQPIGENVKPVYLSIKNPKIYTTEQEYDDYVMSPSPTFDSNLKKLKNQGFDGIVYKPEDSGSTYYVAFEPTQIKSAIGNRGTFNPNSPSIIEDDIPAIKIKPHKQLQKEAPKVPKKVYDDAKQRSVMDIAKERTKELKGPGLISRALTPMSTRLRVLAPELKRAIRRFQSNVDINTSKDLKVAENFMKQTDKLRRKNKQDYAVLDLAMKNSDLKKAEEILDKYDMGSEFVKVRNMLDNIYVRAEMVGYEPNYLSDYFPRKIKDSDGLMGYLEASDSWGVIQSNIKSKETELGRRLEKDERLKLINNLIRGFGGRLGIQRPANLKEREIEYLDSELNEFYFDSNTALHKYIVQMNEAIEIKRFFGKGMGPEDPNIQVDNNVIGEYVDTLLDQGIIKSTQQDELINLLRIRFAQGPMDPRMAKTRNTAYLFTMGQLSSAVTQIGDLAWSIYNAGVMETGRSLGKSAVGKSILTRKDIGIEKIAQEFTETDKAHKILDTVFTLTGLKYIDSLGKESLINATISKYQKQARKGKFSSKLQERLDEAFDKKELPKVIADLKSGEVTDDIKYLAHYILSDFQPVSLTEMPEFYLKAPNGRVMYMLKTYTMKQYDIIRNESFKKMKEGKTVKEKAEGLRRLIYLASVLMLTGMSSDKIKNYLYGREQEFDEMISDNMLRLVGFQKYLLWHFRRYKNVAWTTVKALVPPVGVFNPVFESFIRDLDKYQRTKKKGEEFKIPGDTESVKNIPIVGRLYYNYFGNGEKFHAKRKEKETKKKGKKKKRRPTI